MFLAKGSTARHVYERAQVFLQNDPSLQDIAQDFTPNMFSVQGIEVLGTPIDTDTYIKTYVTQNCLKIIRDTEKDDPLTDGFVHHQLMNFFYEHTYSIHECKYYLSKSISYRHSTYT